MKSHEGASEIVIADEVSPVVREVRDAAEDLLSGAAASYQPEDDPDTSYAGFICRAEDLDENHSRYVGLAQDPTGLLIVERSFSEADVVPLPIAGAAEIIAPQTSESPLIVNFYSRLIEEAGVRLEGVETEASDDELANMIQTMRHPDLIEIDAPEITVRYANLFVGLLQDHDKLRAQGWETFRDRNIVKLQDELAKKASQLALPDQAEVLDAKIKSPLRGVLSEAVQPFSSKLARRILGI